jgi:hypothetical protein
LFIERWESTFPSTCKIFFPSKRQKCSYFFLLFVRLCIYIVPHGLLLCIFLSLLAYIYRPLMYSLRVIQYTSFLSIRAQVLNHLYIFIFSASSQKIFGAAVASAIPHRFVFLVSPSPSPCFELVHIPIETLRDNPARAVENSQIGVFLLPHAPPEDSAAASGFCRSAADTAVRSLLLPPRLIAQPPSYFGPKRTSPSDGGRASTRRSNIWPSGSRAQVPPPFARASHAPNLCCATSTLVPRQP